MRGLFQAAAGYIRSLGWIDGLLLLLDRGLRRLTDNRARVIKYRLVAQPVPDQPWLPPGRGSRIEVRSLDPDAAALAAFPRSPEVYRFRFQQGARCIGAFRDGEPVGFIWFTLSGYEEDEVRCRYIPVPEEVTAWDFDIYIAPQHRIGPAFLRLWDVVNEELCNRGVRWTLSRISAFNPSSIGAHQRLGMRPLGSLTFFCAGPLQAMVGTVKPWIHVSWRQQSRPIVTLVVDRRTHANRRQQPSATLGL